MGLRIFKKATLLTWRAKKRFLAFVLIYCLLITMTALGIESDNSFTVFIFALGSVVVATMYGFLLTNFSRHFYYFSKRKRSVISLVFYCFTDLQNPRL